MIVEDGVHTDINAFVSGCAALFEVLIYANLLFYLMNPHGYEYSGGSGTSVLTYYFFGNYNTTIKYIMPGLLFALLRSYQCKGRITVRFWSIYIAMLVFFFQVGATTITIALLICGLGLLYYIFRKSSGIFRYEIFLLLSLILTIIFVIIGNFDIFSSFITNVLGKDLTLSRRTLIWDRAISCIVDRPVWGYGQVQNSVSVSLIGSQAAHNILLDILYYSGIIGLIWLIVLLVIVGRKLVTFRKIRHDVVFAFDIVFCSYFLMWVFNPFGNIISFYMLYLVLALAYYCEKMAIDSV